MIISGRGRAGMGVMGRFVGGGVDWVSSISVFFFFFLFFFGLVTCISYLLTHTLLLLYRSLYLLFSSPPSTSLIHSLVSRLPPTSPGSSFVQPSITSIRSLPLFGLLFPHIIDTYHIVTTAVNSVCIFAPLLFRFWVGF